MHLLRVTVPVYLPPDSRPEPQAIADWLGRAIATEEADVQRVDSTSLEFQTPLVHGRVTFRADGTFQGIAEGIVEVERAPHGFDIIAEAKPRAWVLIVPVLAIGVASGAIADPDQRWIISAISLGAVGVTWLNGWLHLRSAFRMLAEDIMRSYSTVPPK